MCCKSYQYEFKGFEVRDHRRARINFAELDSITVSRNQVNYLIKKNSLVIHFFYKKKNIKILLKSIQSFNDNSISVDGHAIGSPDKNRDRQFNTGFIVRLAAATKP